MSPSIKHLVVVGNGLVAWWAAIYLKQAIKNSEITILTNGVEDVTYAESTESNFGYFLSLIGLTESLLVQHADANFSFANCYSDWSVDQERYYHSSDVYNYVPDTVEFNQWMLKLRHHGITSPIDEYSLFAMAAKLCKAPTELMGVQGSRYGLHLDGSLLANLLREHGTQRGVKVVEDNIQAIQLYSDGSIQSIYCNQHGTLTGDFYIDASGSNSKLMGDALEIPFDSWQLHFPCNRRKIFSSSKASRCAEPFTTLKLTSSVWVKAIPLRSKVICEVNYSDAQTDINIASDDLLGDATELSDSTINIGCRKKIWHKNCLAIGGAGVCVDNFSHSELHLAAVTLKRFVDVLPGSVVIDSSAQEFNRLMLMDYHSVRDYHSLHYWLAEKNSTACASKINNLTMTESLAYRLSLFKECGKCMLDESSLIVQSQWTSLMLGLGCWPKDYDYVARHHPIAVYIDLSTAIKNNINKRVDSMPGYENFMANYLESLNLVHPSR